MKVTLLNTDDYSGGAAIACRRLLKSLTKHTDVDAVMLVGEKKSTQEGVIQLNNTWVEKKLSYLRFVAERIYFLAFEKSKQQRFAFNPGKFGIDISDNENVKNTAIIHLHWINFGFLSIDSINKLAHTGKPIVWTLHDMWAFTGGCHHSGECENYQVSCGNCHEFLSKPSENDLSHKVWQQKSEVFENANLTIVTCSDWLKRRAEKSSLFKNLRIVTIPNPIDTEEFKPYDRDTSLSFFNLSKEKKYILFAAMRVTAIKKGFQYFKDALKIYKEKSKDTSNIEILLFGAADMNDFADIDFKINLLGKLDSAEAIAKAYSAASIFVIPSLEENLPNTIVESMSCGTPVVGFDIGGIPELISHKTTGYLAKYKSSEDLADGIDWLLQHSASQELKNNCRQKISANIDQKVISRKYEALYQSLI